MNTIEQAGRPIDADDLAILERDLHLSLPPIYRKFLLRNNGGTPSSSMVDVKSLDSSPTDLQVFFGIDRSVESSTLAWNRRMFAGRIPAALLPIACDSGGNLFAVSLSPENLDEVYYVDLGVEPAEVYLVSSDVQALFASLR